MDRITTKRSTIFVATGDRMQVFQSVDEMPASLREQLAATTQGMNSATILIADKGGREEILKAVRRSEDGSRFAQLFNAVAEKGRATPKRFPFILPLIGRILLVGSLAYVLWVLATAH